MNNKIKKIEQLFDMTDRFHKIAKLKGAIDAENIITSLQIDALLYLHKHPKSTVNLLGKYLSLSSSAVAQLTDRLAKSGFVTRIDDPADRRIVRLFLTPDGEQVFRRFYKVKIDKVKKVAPFLTNKDLDDLTRIYLKIFRNLEGRNNEK